MPPIKYCNISIAGSCKDFFLKKLIQFPPYAPPQGGSTLFEQI